MIKERLSEAFDLLHDEFGPQYWWPGETSLEIIVGAILTQNTNWKNVERAITNLKAKSLIDLKKLRDISEARLAELIRPAGYYNIKTRRLKNFVKRFVSDYDGNLDRISELPLSEVRDWLLSINGIGPETADSILLYALTRPIFVVDAYTKRVLERHSMIPEEISYDELQELFMDNLPNKAELFNEYHALLVRIGKDFCKKVPLCEKCPLKDWNR